MQNLARDEAGNVWELDAQGNAVRMVESAAPATGRVFTLPQSPKEVRQEQRQEAQDNRADRREERAVNNDAISNELKRLELELKRAELNKDTGGNRAGSLRSLVGQINRVQELFNSGPGATSGVGSVKDYLPTSTNKQFDAAGANLSQQGLAAFRVPGTGTVSDRDAIMFDKANLPQASSFDAATQEQLRGLRARVEEEYKTLGLGTPGWQFVDDADEGAQQKADNEVPDPTTGASLKPPAPGVLDATTPNEGGGGPAGKTVASGGSRTVFDARVSSQIDAMVNAGASKGMIDAVLKKQNFPVVTPSEWTAIQTWRKQNPGKRYYGANISRSEDLNLLQKAAGSETGAFLTHMANNATAGIPAALAGPEGQGALDAMAANSPNAAGFGGLTGAVTGMLGAEAAIAARAPAALAQYAPRIADTLYGGLMGFNQSREGEGGMGALTGAGAGLVGGVVGERAMRGIGAVARGVTDPAVQHLRSLDIPLTVGQAVGNSGRLGQAVKKVEDSLTSLPFVGNMVDARRMEGIREFNRAAFDTAGSQVAGDGITETGAEGIQQLRGLVGQSYRNALDPVRIDASDPAFIADLAAANASAARIPDVNGARGAADAALDARISGAIEPESGLIPGRNFQEAYRGLARTGRERANGDYGYEIGQVMRQGQDSLAGALERQNPGAFDAFRAANATNRNANVLAEAVNKAKNVEDELFTPAQLNMVDAASARRLTGPLASAAGERPFHELATTGQSVLPSTLPDSGTWTRALVGGGATGVLGTGGYAMGGGDGAATGTGMGLGAMLTLAIGGSRPAQRALTSMLTDRPDMAVRLGDILLENARFGGGAGAGATASLLTAP